MSDSTLNETPLQVQAVAIAASAGGLDALEVVLAALPGSLPAVVFVLLHRSSLGFDFLARLLARRCRLPVSSAVEGEYPQGGRVVVAPAGRQLDLGPGGRLSIVRSDRINFVCPSADVLFTSVARRYGAGALGCVLTGTGRDGAAGVRAIGEAGGFVIAQRGAAFTGMPDAAVETGKVDLVLPLPEIGPAIADLVNYRETA